MAASSCCDYVPLLITIPGVIRYIAAAGPRQKNSCPHHPPGLWRDWHRRQNCNKLLLRVGAASDRARGPGGDRDVRPLHHHLSRHPRRRQSRPVPGVPGPGLLGGLRRLARQVPQPVPGPQGHRPADPELGQRAPLGRRGAGRRGGRGAVPQHHPALLPELRAVRPSTVARGLPPPPGGHPRPQPLVRRLRGRVPRAAGGHRPDLPQRHRPRHRGRPLDQGARLAGRGPAAQRPAGRQVDQAASSPRLRPVVGRVPGARHPDQQSRRHRLPRVRRARRRRRC